IINNIPFQLSDITIPIDVEVNNAQDYAIIAGKKLQYNNGEPIPLKIFSKSNDLNNQTLVVETNEYSENEYESSDAKLEESKEFLVIENSNKKPILEINNTQVKYQNESFDNYNFYSEQASDPQTIKCYCAQPQKTCPKYIQVREAISCFITKKDFEETNLSSENNLQLQQFLTKNDHMFSKGMNDLGKTTIDQHQIITEN
ncbi:13366_t:CDS:2, partial [Racocetra persica]